MIDSNPLKLIAIRKHCKELETSILTCIDFGHCSTIFIFKPFNSNPFSIQSVHCHLIDQMPHGLCDNIVKLLFTYPSSLYPHFDKHDQMSICCQVAAPSILKHFVPLHSSCVSIMPSRRTLSASELWELHVTGVRDCNHFHNCCLEYCQKIPAISFTLLQQTHQSWNEDRFPEMPIFAMDTLACHLESLGVVFDHNL